jgi:ABC-2 type transport system permease protein
MSQLRALREVALWELVRYAKPKQQVVGFVTTVAILMGISLFGQLGGEPDEVRVAVVGAEHLPTLPPEAGRFAFTMHGAGELDGLRDQVDEGDLPAVLVLSPDGTGELLVPRPPTWEGELSVHLSQALALQRIEEAGLDPATLVRIQTPFLLEISETEMRGGRAATLTAMLGLGMMMYGLFVGVGYIFASVTGEKQNRVSEQVVSSIPAQTWIDGKIVGLAGVAASNVLNAILAFGTWFLLRALIWDEPLPAVPALEDPALLLLPLGFMLLGFFFWFALITMVAATVDDPNNSNRTILIFLPMLAAVPGFLAVNNPDATWVQVLSIVPPTSFAVMPARILTVPVPVWEMALAALLLLGGVMLVRRLAGKIFRLAMLMHGKEPGWREIRRWLAEA